MAMSVSVVSPYRSIAKSPRSPPRTRVRKRLRRTPDARAVRSRDRVEGGVRRLGGVHRVAARQGAEAPLELSREAQPRGRQRRCRHRREGDDDALRGGAGALDQRGGLVEAVRRQDRDVRPERRAQILDEARTVVGDRVAAEVDRVRVRPANALRQTRVVARAPIPSLHSGDVHAEARRRGAEGRGHADPPRLVVMQDVRSPGAQSLRVQRARRALEVVGGQP